MSQILDTSVPLTGTPFLDSVTVGVHFYNSCDLPHHSAHFSPPPHKDSGTLTILFRSHDENYGLEVADLKTTQKTDSEGVGSDATFIPVPTSGEGITEVVVFAGTRLQNFLERDQVRNQVRACVHRVRSPRLGGLRNTLPRVTAPFKAHEDG